MTHLQNLKRQSHINHQRALKTWQEIFSFTKMLKSKKRHFNEYTNITKKVYKILTFPFTLSWEEMHQTCPNTGK